MERPEPPADAPSRLLEAVLAEESVTVGDIVDRGAESGFGLVLVLVALPTLIPVMPPGVATALGLLMALLGAQMLVGMTHPYLPRAVRNRPVTGKVRAALRHGGVVWMRRIEARTRTRAPRTNHPLVERTVAVLVILIGVVLFLPVPFMNTLPAVSVLVMGVGLLGRDGIVVLAGAVLAAVLVVLSAGILVGAVQVGMQAWRS